MKQIPLSWRELDMNNSIQEGAFFMTIAKNQLRQIISENNITSVTDIYTLFKDSFKDILKDYWKLKWMLLLTTLKMRKIIYLLQTKGMIILLKQ